MRVFEEDIGPLNGAKIVAHAWSDPVYRHRLLQDGNAAIAELGFQLPQKLVVLENSAAVPNVFVSHCARVTRAVLGLLISSNTFAEIHDTISIRVWNGAVQAAASLIRLAARSDHVSIPSDAN